MTLDAQDALRRLAADHGATCIETLTTLLGFAEKDAAIARKTLRRAADSVKSGHPIPRPSAEVRGRRATELSKSPGSARVMLAY
jgi:hypothetical protein